MGYYLGIMNKDGSITLIGKFFETAEEILYWSGRIFEIAGENTIIFNAV